MSTPYVTFPGTTGNYVSTADVNLLDADSAHLQQSVGQWDTGALSTTHVLFGDNSLKVTGGVDTTLTPGTDAAMFSCYVYSEAGADFDINGSAAVTVPAGTWTQLSEAGPDGTYTIGCSTAGDYWVDKACVRAGADPTFVPSLRIVGDLDLRAKIAPDNWAGTFGTIVDIVNAAATTGFRLYTYSSALWFIAYGSTGLISESTTALSMTNGAGTEIRMTADVSAGSVIWYQNGSQVDTDSFTPQTLLYSARNLFCGSRTVNSWLFDGAIYWVEVRDGIDGPVAARFDAADVAGQLT